MKTTFRKTGILFLAAFALTSCEKNDDRDPIDVVPTASEFNALRQEAMDRITQHFTLTAEDGQAIFTSDKGVLITIDGNCLTLDGNPVIGEVTIEYAEVFDPGTMLVTNKTTMGALPGGGMGLIISGGEFYINATQDGQQLDMGCNLNLKIPAHLTGGIDNDMTLWTGIIDEDGNLEWKQRENNPGTGDAGVFGEGQGEAAAYYAFFNAFEWTNVDRFYFDPRPKTTILADVPDGYTFGNSSVYLHYDGEGSSLAKLDTYDNVNELFTEHYGQIPIGLECHIIFATEQDGQWRYAIKGVTVQADDVYTFTLEETTLGSEEDLVDAINALP